jgi:hypothetical protein
MKLAASSMRACCGLLKALIISTSFSARASRIPIVSTSSTVSLDSLATPKFSLRQVPLGRLERLTVLLLKMSLPSFHTASLTIGLVLTRTSAIVA